jgi:RND family efflux transporter MFP subunit
LKSGLFAHMVSFSGVFLSAGVAASNPPDSALQPIPEVITPVKVMTLKDFSPGEAPGFPGRVEAGDSVQLTFRVPGQMRSLNVRMGDRVAQGVVLAELDDTDYGLNVDARQAEYDLAELDARRASSLYEQQLISEDQYDRAQTALATSRARLEQAREQLSFCKLTAPFAGAIAFTYAMPSEVVSSQQPILNLQDTSSLDIRFNLPLRYQPLLEDAEPASFSVTFDLMPGMEVPARYKEANMQADPDTNSYPVTLEGEAPDNFSARPGMPVHVRLYHPDLLKTRWVLPEEALFDRAGVNAHVWRIEPASMTLRKTSVEVDSGNVLRSGLKPGDRIVAAGVDRLQEGQRVRAWVREGGL